MAVGGQIATATDRGVRALRRSRVRIGGVEVVDDDGDEADGRWARARREAVRFWPDLFAYPPCPDPSASAEVMAAWASDWCAEVDELREGLALARRYGDEEIAAPWRRAIERWEARRAADLTAWCAAHPGSARPG